MKSNLAICHSGLVPESSKKESPTILDPSGSTELTVEVLRWDDGTERPK